MIRGPFGVVAVVIPRRVSLSDSSGAMVAFDGTLPGGALPRLGDALAGSSPPVDVSLTLVRERDGARWLRGTLTADLPMHCRRCDRAFVTRVEARPALRLVTSEAEETQLLKSCDPLLVEGDELPLSDVVEDEMLLAMPMLPHCAACEAAARQPASEPDAEAAQAGHAPLAGLRQQWDARRRRD